MTSEPPLPWDPPFPWDEHLERIRIGPPARDDDKSEWIKAHLEVRFWIRYLRAYSDLSRHGGVEMNRATFVRYKREDIDEAKKYGDLRQLREAVAQFHGEDIAALLPPPKGKRGGIPNPKLDEAEADYYYIRDLLRRTYLGPDEKRFYGWVPDALEVIAKFHDVDESTLANRIER